MSRQKILTCDDCQAQVPKLVKQKISISGGFLDRWFRKKELCRTCAEQKKKNIDKYEFKKEVD